LAAAAVSTTQANLTWVDNSNNETGFKIERSIDGVTFAQIATAGANIVTYSDATLAANATYTYRVRAYNSTGNSPYSNAAMAAPVTPPVAPTNLVAVAASAAQINLSWTESGTNQAGFRLERSTDGVTYTLRATPDDVDRSYTDVGLTPGTTYYYRVRAVNTAGASAYSNVASTTTLTAAAATYLSDIAWVSATNGWGPAERDTSNGGQAAGDGRAITLNGVTYAKGLGVHASSQIVYNLGGAYSSFLSDVGLDDEEVSGGSVDFQVFADGVKIYDSGVMGPTAATQSLNLSVVGVKQLTLIVTDGGDGIDYDHADWAGARLLA
jgi:hypothetical protein